MQLFYSPQWSETEPFSLSEEESRHAISSLRHQIGDRLMIIDGYGGKIEAEIVSANPKKTMLKFLTHHLSNQSVHLLNIAISPTKSNDRIEWFIEKACEIGIGKITPVMFERTERNKINIERWKKIVVSACKQSQQLYFPEIAEPIKFSKMIDELRGEKVYAAIIEGVNNMNAVNLDTRIWSTILIGPEGDFTDGEKKIMIDRGIQPIKLSESILRVETAGLVTVCQWNNLKETYAV